MNEIDIYYHLLVSLVIGLLVGIERGWQAREDEEGSRIAGVRTYGLLGMLGGGMALLAEHYGGIVLALGFVGVLSLFALFAFAKQRQNGDWGVTSLVAALLTYILAALAMSGFPLLAISATVITVLLLSYKAQLHNWLRYLGDEELKAGIKLLLISLVLLPVLPNKAFDPWGAFNPFEIWLMVVVISLISFFGYFAIKLGGLKRGIIFIAFFGGLASSTAVTLHLSRIASKQTVRVEMFASAILIACSTMFVRMLVVVSLMKASLLSSMLLPVLVLTLVTALPALFYWRTGGQIQSIKPVLTNPLELKTALTFGFILFLVMLLSEILREHFGDAGVVTLAVVSGIADVDAIVLSLLRMVSDSNLAVPIFLAGSVIAAAMNSLFKASLAYSIGGRALGIRVAIPLVSSFIIALIFSFFWLR